jgi:hypothetical protein
MNCPFFSYRSIVDDCIPLEIESEKDELFVKYYISDKHT